MWTVRELKDNQICVGLRVHNATAEGLMGTVVYTVQEGYDNFAWVRWDNEISASLSIKNGDSDLLVDGWLR